MGISLPLVKVPGLFGGGGQTFDELMLTYSPSGYYPMKESSGTAISDLTSNLADITATGATPAGITGPDGGNAWLFDGVNDLVDALTALGAVWNTTQGAVVMWVYDNVGTGLRYAFSASQGGSDPSINLYLSTTHRAHVFMTGSSEGAAAAVTNQWRALGVSWNVTGNVKRAALNGAELSMAAATLSGTLTPTQIYLGRRFDGRYWSGGICRFAYWNTEQSLATLQALTEGGA